MRRLLCATALSGALVLLGACSGPAEEGSAPASPAASQTAAPVPSVDPSAAAAADKALGDNTEAICAQVKRTSGAFVETLRADIKAQTEAKGAAAVTAAKEKTKHDLESQEGVMTDLSRLTTDAKLKKAFGDAAAQVAAIDPDASKLKPGQLEKLSETLSRAC
jgi:hypothetical protein